MTTAVLTPARLFRELDEQFDDYDAFQTAFVDSFNRHRWEFPPGYGWRDALQWGVSRGIVRRQGREVLIHRQSIPSPA